VDLSADEVEVVEDFSGLRIPRGAWRGFARVRHVRRRKVSRIFTSAGRKKARAHERAQEFESGGLLCSQLRSFYVGRLPFRRRRDLLRLYMSCERCETQDGADEQNMTKDHAHSPLGIKAVALDSATRKSLPSSALRASFGGIPVACSSFPGIDRKERTWQ